jgi:exodeoxyribonuclease-3
MMQNKFFIYFILFSSPMILASCHAPLKSSGDSSNPSLKIISYNVLYGFNHQENIKEGVAWIRSQDPDVLALQELNDFNEQKLRELAVQWNHNYAVILKEDGFPVGLTSKTPIEVIEKRIEGLHHGYLHCRTEGIDFMVIHLAPHEYLKRLQEMDIIVEKIKNLLAENKRVIALGDFNSFSPTDKHRTDMKVDLLNRQKISNLNNGQLDYSVMEKFRKTGLIDICARLLPDTDSERFSFPTKIVDYIENEEDQMRFARRIDYIWMDPNLAERCIRAFVPRDVILDSISDHFPVIAVIQIPENDIGQ